MEVDMLLNMDGFDDNLTPVFYANSGGTPTFTVSPAFSASDAVAVHPRSELHLTASYHGRSQFSGNSTRPWSEANMYPYGFQGYHHYSTTGTLHDPGLGHSDQTPSSNPDRSSMSTRPVVPRSREDAPWQMYLSASLSDSLHSLDLDIPDPGLLDLVHPEHELAHKPFSDLETLESPSSSYQGAQTANDIQRIFCTTPLVSPQPRNIRPALLSLMSTQDPENSLQFAQGDNSTKAGEHTVYTSSLSDFSAPKFDFCMPDPAPSSPPIYLSRGRSPTITKLVNHSTTRPRRGLTGWGNTNHLEPPAVPSSTGLHRKKLPSGSISKSPNPGSTVQDSISPPLTSSTRGSSGNSERLLKRLRKSDESPPNLKRASKTRRLTVADIDTEDDGADNGGDSDSDDYTPSRSPSVDPSRSISPPPSSHSVMLQQEPGVISTLVTKKTMKGKGKAKGSAALALAVVSQMIHDPSTGRRDIDLTSLQTTRYGVRRRKNQPIPLPIPVPNLNKKSRGRKVPHISNDTVTKIKLEEEEEEDDESGEDQSRSSTRSRRKPTVASMSKSSSGENRTFVCVVSGCGKCFVRSEHLKRHVRSIHTNDKPHPCPFEGCDKSFSRRDNLGQHVRIHLQS